MSNSSNPSATNSTFTLGQTLQNARESQNLSIDEVALKTHLKRTVIESLENDIFILPNIPPAFVRGYVRNYVRFLRLPESLIQSVNYGEITLSNPPKKAVIKTNNPSQGRWLKRLTFLVLLVAFGMTLVWWWQEYQKEQQSREQLVSEAPAAQVETTTAAPISSENRSSTDQAQPAQAVTLPAQPTATETAPASANVEPADQPVQPAHSGAVPLQTEPAAQAVEQKPIDLINKTEVATVATPAETVTTTETAPTLPNSTVSASTNSEATPVATPAVENSEPAVNVLLQTQTQPSAETANTEVAQTETAPVINEELRIEITNNQSWVTVRGAKNKRLAEKTYSAGEVLSFNDNEQYRLTIGAPANVKIYYKGQEIPLKVDGRVARIRLPLAQ